MKIKERIEENKQNNKSDIVLSSASSACLRSKL